MQGVSRAERERRADELLNDVGLAGFATSYPSVLSVGMRQRVGVARAFISDVQLLLMDEPFGALDALTKRMMQEELLRLWRLHRHTLVFVTHDVDEAVALADRIIVMTKRPATVQEQFVLPPDRPRGPAARKLPEARETGRRIWDLVMSDVGSIRAGRGMTSAVRRSWPFPAPLISITLAVGALSFWELMSRIGFISPLLAPAPTAVVRALIAEFTTGEIGPHILITLYRVVSGILIGGSAGLVMGLLMGTSRRLRDIADPFVAAIHPNSEDRDPPRRHGTSWHRRPVTDSGDLARRFLPDDDQHDERRAADQPHTSRCREKLRCDRRRSCSARVVLPASLPMVLSGLRIAVNLALLITISVEIAGATKGLGALIWISWEVMRIEVLYASLLVIMALGISANLLVRLLSDVVAPWSRSSGGDRQRATR